MPDYLLTEFEGGMKLKCENPESKNLMSYIALLVVAWNAVLLDTKIAFEEASSSKNYQSTDIRLTT